MDSDREVMRYILPRFEAPPVAGTGARAGFARCPERYYAVGSRYGVFAAIEKATGDFIGWFLLRPAMDHRLASAAGFGVDELELGYRFRRAFWGRGLATEGARALVQYARADAAVSAVVAVALQKNVASTRVMEKAGLMFRAECVLPGYDLPGVTYRLAVREVGRRLRFCPGADTGYKSGKPVPARIEPA
jgi:RimJ/RimL family protein N-acetyltransferase